MSRGSFAELEDVRLHYRFEEQFDGADDAPVVVLSHALGANLDLWDRQVAGLGSKLRLLRYDARGHGLSSVPDGDSSLADLGRDVLQLLESLRIDKAYFCGISLGGITALWLAIHAPARLHGIVAADTAAHIGTHASWTGRMEQVRQGGMASLADGTVERWYTAEFRQREPEQTLTTRRWLLQNPVNGYLSCCAALRDADLTAAVGSIALPVLVATGRHDPVTPPQDGRFLEQQVDGARYVELNGAHLSNVEDAGSFNAAVSAFVHSER